MINILFKRQIVGMVIFVFGKATRGKATSGSGRIGRGEERGRGGEIDTKI